MSATFLVWKSHNVAGGSSGSKSGIPAGGFGHVSLAIVSDNTTTQDQIATISWFADDDAPGGSSSTSDPYRLPGPIQYELVGYTIRDRGPGKKNVQEKLDELNQQMNQLQMGSPEWTELHRKKRDLERWYPQLNRQMMRKPWLGKYINKFNKMDGTTLDNQLRQLRIRPADEEVTVPTLSDKNVHCGLNDVAMLEWWKSFADERQKYHFMRRNCATACASAIIAGGGRFMVHRKDPALAWKPDAVLDWARKLKDRYAEQEQYFQNAKQILENLIQHLRRLRLLDSSHPGTVFTKAEFKKRSDRGLFARRRGLKFVDDGLEHYHQAKAKRSSGGTAADRNIELQWLVAIALGLAKYLQDRPKTKREFTIGRLAEQVLLRIRYLKVEQISIDLKEKFDEIATRYQDELDFRSIDEVQSYMASNQLWATGQREYNITQDLRKIREIAASAQGFDFGDFDLRTDDPLGISDVNPQPNLWRSDSLSESRSRSYTSGSEYSASYND